MIPEPVIMIPEPEEDPLKKLTKPGSHGLLRPHWRAALAGCGACAVLGSVTMGIFAATGVITIGGNTAGSEGGVEQQGSSIEVPHWQPGATFTYSINTWRNDTSGLQHRITQHARAVNVGKDPATQHYMLAAEELESALEHAVLNGFPFFGRVASADMGVYEDGAPQALFGFWPMKVSTKVSDIEPWHFRLFQTNWQGAVVAVEPHGAADGKSALIKFQATQRPQKGSHTKSFLSYELDMGVGFLSHLVFIAVGSGETQLEMQLESSQASGFKGNAYFVRATDISDNTWTLGTQPNKLIAAEEVLVGRGCGYSCKSSSDCNAPCGICSDGFCQAQAAAPSTAPGGSSDGSPREPTLVQQKRHESSFSVGQHRTDGAWDMLVYVTDVALGCDGSSAATLKLTPHNAPQHSALVRSFSGCQSKTTIGTISQPLDKSYTVDVSLTGPVAAMRVQVAGGLLFNYTV